MLDTQMRHRPRAAGPRRGHVQEEGALLESSILMGGGVLRPSGLCMTASGDRAEGLVLSNSQE